MKQRSSFELLKSELEIFRIRNTSYSFSALQKVLEMHGWTLKEYNEECDKDRVVRKLKGH